MIYQSICRDVLFVGLRFGLFLKMRGNMILDGVCRGLRMCLFGRLLDQCRFDLSGMKRGLKRLFLNELVR